MHLLVAHMAWFPQASLEETQSEQKQTAYAAELMRQGASHESATTSTMGLRNATGEYNCFLNVIIQCMWHCRLFRQAVMTWDPSAYQVHCRSGLTALQHVQLRAQAGLNSIKRPRPRCHACTACMLAAEQHTCRDQCEWCAEVCLWVWCLRCLTVPPAAAPNPHSRAAPTVRPDNLLLVPCL